MAQLLLLPDPRPLDERLGKQFFLDAPKQPGVYLMRNSADAVLYVGKAKSLKQRLGNYRIANPDRMPRRHLRMLRQVVRIEIQPCADEAAALVHESKLIRELKPKFNRAGVWPCKIKFIVWQTIGEILQVAIVEVAQDGWQQFGPMNSSGRFLHQTLVRMLWLAVNQDSGVGMLPAGWAQGRMAETVSIPCRTLAAEIAAHLDTFFLRSADEFLLWLGQKFSHRTQSFERAMIDADLKVINEFAGKRKQRIACNDVK